ncbi:hypothetical protein LX36DRAFT_25663 [Colletotrichum falcatum]|nr:hypothetical protein LX36DRAFT_25663 [Colletotrichum falcatum]
MMDTQGASLSAARKACKAAIVKSISWSIHAPFRAMGKLSYHKLSSHAQAEPIVGFQPTVDTRRPLTHDHKQQEVRSTSLESGTFDDKSCDLVYCGDDFFPEKRGEGRYDHYDYEGDMHVSQDEFLEEQDDDLVGLLGKQPHSDAPILILTTPGGKSITGDGIPEGTKCHFSDEYRALQRQWLDNVENSLIPGNWKQIRDLNGPQEDKALCKRHLRVEEEKRKRHAERAEGQRRRQKTDAAERARQLQKMQVEYDDQERRYRDEERRYQTQQPQVRHINTDFERWIDDVNRQQDEAERRLQEIRDSLKGRTGWREKWREIRCS